MAQARRAEILRHPGLGRHRGHREPGRHLPRRAVRGRTRARRHHLYLYGDHAAADHHPRAVRRHRGRHDFGRPADPAVRCGRGFARQPELRRELALRGQAHGHDRRLPAARQQRRGGGQEGQGGDGTARKTHARRHCGHHDRRHHDQHRRRYPGHIPHAGDRPPAGDLHHLPLHPGLAGDRHPARGDPRLAHRRLRALPAAGVLGQHHLAAGAGAGHRPGGRRRHRGRRGRAGQHRRRHAAPRRGARSHEERRLAHRRHDGRAAGRIRPRVVHGRHHRPVVPAVLHHDRRLGGDLGIQRPDALPGAVRPAAAPPRTAAERLFSPLSIAGSPATWIAIRPLRRRLSAT